MSYHDLGKEIAELYTRSAFGKILKSEIDLFVFRHFMTDILASAGQGKDYESFGWYEIGNNDIRALSLKLGITERKVSSMIEQCALASGLDDISADKAIEMILKLSSMANQSEKDECISLYIPNKITRRAIEAFLASGQGMPDTSFNRDILKIRLIDIMMASLGNDNGENFVRYVIDRIKEQDSAFNLSKSMKKFDEKNIGKYMENIMETIITK